MRFSASRTVTVHFDKIGKDFFGAHMVSASGDWDGQSTERFKEGDVLKITVSIDFDSEQDALGGQWDHLEMKL